MLTSELIKTIKKMNASKDVEKSKTRIAEDFKASSNKVKLDIIELSGQTRSSFYRTFETGNASLKTILSLAQTLNVSPYYYSGAVDDKGECSEEIILDFLKDYGCIDTIAAYKKMSRKKRIVNSFNISDNNICEDEKDVCCQTIIPAEESSSDTVPDNDEQINTNTDDYAVTVKEKAVAPTNTNDISPNMLDAMSSLDEDTAILLLKALIIRAKAGGHAEELYFIVRRCLLS